MKKPSSFNRAKKQRVILPILLWLIPLFALNFGFYFLSGIDLHWREIEQTDKANQEIEALSASSDFSYQFSRICGQFRQTFQSAVDAELSASQLKRFLKDRAGKIFRYPFPEKDLMIFQIPEKSKRVEMLLFDGDKIISRRAFSRVFEYLVSLNRKDEQPDFVKKQNEKLLNSLLGPESSGSVMAVSQRARTTYAFYNTFPHWFIWDYFTVPGKGTFGYLALSPCLDKNRFDGMLLSLRDFRDRRLGFAAFVPLFRGYGGSVFQAPLNKSNLFRNWLKTQVTMVEDDLGRWLASGTPKVTELGNFKLFSYLGKGNTHMTTLLLPRLKQRKMPIWISLTNFFIGGLIILMLLRGFLLEKWPEIKLKLKFQIIFLLAATLPLSLLLIASSGYISQFRRALHFQTVSNLLMCIKQFDSRKAQVTDEYRSSFVKLVKNPEFSTALKQEGANSKRAEDILKSYFIDRERKLPLMCYAILDDAANGIRGFGEGWKEGQEAFIESFSFPIVGYLREKLKTQNPEIQLKEYKPSELQAIGAEAYNSLTSRDLLTEIGRRRSFPLVRQRGSETATQMHDYIAVDGIDRYALLIAWEDSAMDDQTIRQTSNFLALNNPEFDFVHFKVTAQGLEFLKKPDRHVPQDALNRAEKLAETVYFRGSYSSTRTDDFSIVAYPSKKYGDTIIVGISRNFSLNQAVTDRIAVLGFLFLMAVILVFVSAYLAAKMILDPITRLKSSLDQVAAGNLDAEIPSAGSDELGKLAEEFSNMAHGLRERRRLASLLSDHAIEALSKNQNVDGMLSGESFNGVALVSDIRNFTGLCEEFPPDQITALLNEHFARMAEIISEKGGRIYKFIGDAIEAVFPEVGPEEESAEVRAFKAASMMNIEMLKINRNRSSNGLFQYKIGVGLASGRFFSGGVGSLETRLDYAVLGEALKKAAKLEAMSIQNPSFPIVVDKKMSEIVGKLGVKFSAAEESDNAYIVSEIGSYEISAGFEAEKQETVSEDFDMNDLNIVEGSSFTIPKWFLYLSGVTLIAAFLFGIYSGIEFSRLTGFNTQKVALSESALRLVEQLKSNDSGLTGFQSVCARSVNKIEEKLEINPNAKEKKVIEASLLAEIDNLESNNLKPDRVAAFYFESQKTSSDGSVVAILNQGWKSEEIKVLQKFSQFKYEFDRGSEREDLYAELKLEIPLLFGETISMVNFHAESFGTAINVSIDNRAEILFTRYLVARSDRLKEFDLVNNISLLRTINRPDLYRIVGMVVFSVPRSACERPEALVNSFAKDEFKLRLLDENDVSYESSGFPEKAELDQGVLINDQMTLGESKYRIEVFARIAENEESNFFDEKVLLLILGLFCLWYLSETIEGKSFFNRSLRCKLWLAFLLSSIVPLITVYFVVDLFTKENLTARVSQEKSDLQRFVDLFELRQTFSEPLAWKILKNWSFSEELKRISSDINQQPGSTKDFSGLDSIFAEWQKRSRELRKTVSNFWPVRAAIVSKEGWEYVYRGEEVEWDATNPNPVSAPDDQFAVLLAKIGKNLILRMRKEDTKARVDADSLKGEMALKIGLQTVRGMFGEDISVKLANGVGLPVRMSMLDAMVGMIIHPVEQIIMPDYIIIWMALFKNGEYLNDIAKRFKGDYAIFPFESNKCGHLTFPDKNLFDLDLAETTSWVSSANLPVSLQKEYEGKRFLIEARPGVQQLNMIVTGIRALDPVFESVAATKRIFLSWLFVSIILVIFLAKNVSAEIIEPVKRLTKGMQEMTSENFSYRIDLSRSDELGDLCNSFDSMAKGLEEKFVMGKMLSQNAMESTLRDVSSRKEDVVVFYVGSPGFESWLNLSSPGELFADLQKQISEISRIILDQGGDIDKIIGDKILAVFRGDMNHASIMACKAAMKIMNAEQRGILPFPAAAGINNGTVIAGSLGVGNKKDFTVIGDAVNVAARIENLAETMRYHRMLISEEVYNRLNADVRAREYGSVELKGKSATLRVFQLELL